MLYNLKVVFHNEDITFVNVYTLDNTAIYKNRKPQEIRVETDWNTLITEDIEHITVNTLLLIQDSWVDKTKERSK